METSRNSQLLSSATVSFADVAHQTLIYDTGEPDAALILALLDTRWMQRLRGIRQTGNTHLVYMFAEHSRFGHSLGVAYLATMLMKSLSRSSPDLVAPYREAVAAAALLHDIGHTAPGSHLAEKVWENADGSHEATSMRIIAEDPEIQAILKRRSGTLTKQICDILGGRDSVPPWTVSIISGGGWNADRGNWTIVDSAMCSVSYGRYNVLALIDAFRLSEDGQLVLQENRLDALTHFFVARDSMYRQVYQHRVLQAVDALTENTAKRLKDIVREAVGSSLQNVRERATQRLREARVFADQTMLEVLEAGFLKRPIPLETIFRMTESWWSYHRDEWCSSGDAVLADLAKRHRDRRLLKTIRLDRGKRGGSAESGDTAALVERARSIALELNFDPQYYVTVVQNTDIHRAKKEAPPLVLLDNGEIVPATTVEPLIAEVLARSAEPRGWLVVPREVKERLGKIR